MQSAALRTPPVPSAPEPLLRSAALLSPQARAALAEAGVALAYDPVQQGWTPLDCEDDIDGRFEGFGAARPAAGAGSAESAAGAGASPQARAIAFRPWRDADLDDFVALLDNPRVWRFLPETYPAPLTRDLARDLIVIANAGGHHEVRALLEEGRPVGQVRLAFTPGRDAAAAAEISYWIGEPHWGRGLGAAAVDAFTRACFASRPSLRSIFARVHRENHASTAVLRRSGYGCEGVAPDDPEILIFRRLGPA